LARRENQGKGGALTSVAQRKRNRRRKPGQEPVTSARTPVRQRKLEPIPEQVAKREALGLVKGDELDCAIARALRAGIIDAAMRQEADRLRALHAAMSAAIQSPGRPGDTLGAYQPGKGGPMTDEAAQRANGAWLTAMWTIQDKAGTPAWRAARALAIDGVVVADRESLRAGLSARRE
jgi:hypothetical protein